MGLIDTFLSPLASIVDGFVGDFFNSRSQSRSFDHQMNFANQMFDKQNSRQDYLISNLPQLNKNAQVSAGYNPAFQEGSQGAPTVATPSGGSVGSASPSFNSLANTVGLMQAKNQADALKHQNDLTDAQRQKTEAETKAQEIQNTYMPQLLSGQISALNVSCKVGESHADLNQAQKQEVCAKVYEINQHIENMKQDIEESKARIANLDEQTKISRIEAAFRSDVLKAQINSLAAAANLSYTQAQDLVATQVARIANIEASTLNLGEHTVNLREQTSNLHLQGIGIKIDNDRHEFELEVDKDWKHVDKAIDNAGKVVDMVTGSVGQVVKGVVSVRNMKRADKLANKPKSSSTKTTTKYDGKKHVLSRTVSVTN